MNENLIIMIIDSFPSDMNFLRLYEKDNSAKCFLSERSLDEVLSNELFLSSKIKLLRGYL